MALIQALQDIIDFFIQLCIIFPYSASTIRRQQPRLPPGPSSSSSPTQTPNPNSGAKVCTSCKEIGMVSDTLLQLCTLDESVTSLLATDPKLSPKEAWKKLYGSIKPIPIDPSSYRLSHHHTSKTALALERASKCGKWGSSPPSPLFLKIFHDALGPLEKDISTGMVSPSLMGTSGVIPLTILSTVPDIVRHQANLIVRAERDVFLATNYWQNSVASSFLTNAMRELSARCAASTPPRKVVMKILYDRGSLTQLIDPHHLVSPKEQLSAAVGLPSREEIPNVEVEVMNYHMPMLGTYHCKYLVVDRRVAVVQSNNVQDNDNLEMMVQLEGEIVDGFYDMAMISWGKGMRPNMPTLGSPARDKPIPCLERTRRDSGKDVAGPSTECRSEAVSLESSWIDAGDSNLQEDEGGLRQVASNPKMADQESLATPGMNENPNPYEPPVSRKVVDVLAGVGQQPADIEHPKQVGMKNDTPPSPQPTKAKSQEPLRVDPVTEAWLNSGKPSLSQALILNPSDGQELPEHNPSDPHYDTDIMSETRRVQAQVTDTGKDRLSAIATHLNHTKNPVYTPPPSTISPSHEWTPYIPHTPLSSFPIALVNRRPYGKPEHSDVYVPQNEAWLAALRYAKESVFIQSPTLNTDVLVPAIIEACERGVEVVVWVCLGYNDAGELLPMQGGTNEQVSHHLYASLSEEGKKRLHYHYYVAADHLSPLRAQIKIRSCHIKLMIVDSRIGICGNGNMDTQSWYQSAEVNVLFESEETCRQIIDGLRRCQRTGKYGRVCEDGLWRDAEGKEVEGGLGLTPKGGILLGLKGALKRVRGEGDFR